MGSSLEYGKKKSPHNELMKCNPISIYAKSKYLSSKYLLDLNKNNNFPAVIFRLYQAYGGKQDNNRLIPITISNCFSIQNGIYDDDRCYARIIKLIKDQSNIIYDNLSDKPVHIIKIDNTIAYKAFNYGSNANNYSQELSEAIDTIWSIDPNIIFVIKCTISKDNYNRVKSIYKAIQEEKYDKVLFQGSELKDYAFRVIMNNDNDIIN